MTYGSRINPFHVTAFRGVRSLFPLKPGTTASRHFGGLRGVGRGLVAFGLVVSNIFAFLGIAVVHCCAELTRTHFELSDYILFAVICGSASYLAVPAVQRLGVFKASPVLSVAALLGLTFTYNVTIGIPVYVEIARAVTAHFPIA